MHVQTSFCARLSYKHLIKMLLKAKKVAVFFDGGIEHKGEQGKMDVVRLVPRRL